MSLPLQSGRGCPCYLDYTLCVYLDHSPIQTHNHQSYLDCERNEVTELPRAELAANVMDFRVCRYDDNIYEVATLKLLHVLLSHFEISLNTLV